MSVVLYSLTMRILMTGATGFLGHAIGRMLLLKGHELVVLSRNPKRARSSFPYPARFLEWDGQAGPPALSVFDGVEAVVHLAGEPIAARRWSSEQKRRILESRTVGTKNLWNGIEALRKSKASTPRVFVSASAVGFYGERGNEEVVESSPPGSGFLAEVCRQWEEQIFRLGFDEVRQAAIRIGVVLGREGGALEKLLPIYASGLGGPVGGGKQWMSWIHLEDLAHVFVEAIENDHIRGPVNGVAPGAVTQGDFSQVLGEALGKPSIAPTPAVALKLAMGEMSSIVLEGQRVRPEKLLNAGFDFKYPDLASALREICRPGGDLGDQVFVSEQWVPQPPETVFPFFSEAKNLEGLTPPWLNFRILKSSSDPVKQGTLIDYQLKIHGIPVQWRTLIEKWEPSRQFVDTQLKGPYAKWHHTHSFQPMAGGTLLSDRVLYRLPLGALGKAMAHWKVRKDIDAIFRFRHQRIQEIFQSFGE